MERFLGLEAMQRFSIADVHGLRRHRNKIAATGFLISLLIIHGNLFAYEEPDSFAGLKFGEDLTTQIEKCPSSSYGGIDVLKILQSKIRCYDPIGAPQSYLLYNIGEIQRDVKNIFAHQVDGKLAAATLTFDSSKTRVLLSILKERYGEPTIERVEPWVSKGGVKTTSMEATWKGQNVSITLTERSYKIDQGSINYSTEAWREHLKRKEAEQVKKGASGL